MGNFWSSASDPGHLDGLQFPSPIKRDFDIRSAAVKVDQLLRASINSYRLCAIAPPLTAAYFLGADPQLLVALYEKWVPQLCEDWPEDDPVADSIGQFNLDEFFGESRFEQRYYEYFRDCLTEEKSWEDVAIVHMDQLWTRLTRNNMRPLIELAAGFETDNAMIVAESLAMACTDPEGDFPAVNPEGSAAHDLSPRFRVLARLALETGTYEAVVGLHACAEVFFKPGAKLMDEGREAAILEAYQAHVTSQSKDESSPPAKLPFVEPKAALESQDPHLITFTRSRLVLKYLAT